MTLETEDFISFAKDGFVFASAEGVDFRHLRGHASRAGKAGVPQLEAVEGEWQEEEWEEVEVSDDEQPPLAAPSELDVGRHILDLVNDLADERLEPSASFIEGLDSISISLLANKIQLQFQVQLSLATMMELGTVQSLADEVFRLTAPPQQGLPSQRRRKVVRRQRQRTLPRPQEEVLDDVGAAGPSLEVGMRVRIHSLIGRAELNGTWGTLVAYHLAEDRWQVRLDGDDTAMCKLLLEANLSSELSMATRVASGVKLLHAMPGGPRVYIVHSLGDDIVDDELEQLVIRRSVGHVCALQYDDEAFLCGSVSALVELYLRRLLEDCGGRKGAIGGRRITLAASSFACVVAHEVAIRLAEHGSDVGLVLFDLDLLRPSASGLARSGRPWLGGEIECTLLLARMLGAHAWAEAEERQIARQAPSSRDADELLMKTFWTHVAHREMSRNVFSQLVRSLGAKFDKLRAITADFEPASVFQGTVDLVMSPEGAAAAKLDFQAAEFDEKARRR